MVCRFSLLWINRLLVPGESAACTTYQKKPTECSVPNLHTHNTGCAATSLSNYTHTWICLPKTIKKNQTNIKRKTQKKNIKKSCKFGTTDCSAIILLRNLTSTYTAIIIVHTKLFYFITIRFILLPSNGRHKRAFRVLQLFTWFQEIFINWTIKNKFFDSLKLVLEINVTAVQ